MRILVYHAGALGDFVTVVPCLRLARLLFPAAEIVLLCRPSFGELAAACGLADRTVDSSAAALGGLYVGDPSAARAALGGLVDRAILFTASAPLIDSFRLLCPAVSAHPPFPDRELSTYDFHLAWAAAAFGVRAEHEARRALAPPLLRPSVDPVEELAFIHPGSGAPSKTWPPERHADVAAELRAGGLRVLWSVGPADAAIRDAVEALSRPGDRILADASPLGMARLLARARLYVGMDSGVSHLAAASGCPSVILFGPTNRVVWRPPGAHVRVVPALAACPEGCFRPPRGEACTHKRGGVPECLLRTTPAEVVAAIGDLAGAPDPRALALGRGGG